MLRNLVTVLIISVTLVTGCSSTPSQLYLIEPKSPNSTILGAGELTIVGLESIQLPAYARDVRIATLASAGQIILHDHHRWAEPPEDSIGRVVAHQLASQGYLAISTPYPRGLQTRYRVAIRIHHIALSTENISSLSGLIIVLSGDGRETLAIEPFSRNRSIQGQEMPLYAASIAENLSEVSEVIARLFAEQEKQRLEEPLIQ